MRWFKQKKPLQKQKIQHFVIFETSKFLFVLTKWVLYI